MLGRVCCVLVLIACRGGEPTKSDIDAPPVAGDGAPPPPPGDGGQPPDTAPPVDAAILPGPACGATTCANGTEDCCIGTNSVCQPAGQCPSQGFACDGPEDCAGGTCCFANNAGSECRMQNCQEIACHVNADCPGGVPNCCPKAFTPNYKVCQAAAC